jgi:hypothetical protein
MMICGARTIFNFASTRFWTILKHVVFHLHCLTPKRRVYFRDYKDEDLDTVRLEKLARLKKVIKGVKRNCAFYGLYRRDIS